MRALLARVPVGFVLGTLARDAEVAARLVAACGDAPVAFPRAFDVTADLAAALETLVDLGIGRVPTGGRRPGPRRGLPDRRGLLGATEE